MNCGAPQAATICKEYYAQPFNESKGQRVLCKVGLSSFQIREDAI